MTLAPEPLEPIVAAGGAVNLAAARRRYLAAARRGDRAAAAQVLTEVLDHDVAPAEVLTAVLGRAQTEVGWSWERSTCSVAEEHQISSITSAALSWVTFGSDPPPGPVRMALLCAEGEQHELPARLAAELLGLHSIQVMFLGTSVPAAQLRVFLQSASIDALGVSCTVPANLPGAARAIVVARSLGVPVVVGGPAFGTTPARARRLGANGWAPAVTSEPFELDRVCWPDPLDPPGRGPWTRFAAIRTRVVERAMDDLLRHAGTVGRPVAGVVVHEALDGLARHAEAALLCDDGEILRDHVRWLERRAQVGQAEYLVAQRGWPLLLDATASHVSDVASALRRFLAP